VAVATTLGNEVLNDSQVGLSVTVAALPAAIVWNLVTWWLGIPPARRTRWWGGLSARPVVETAGVWSSWPGWARLVLALAISPPIGMLCGYLTMKGTVLGARGQPQGQTSFFKREQIVTVRCAIARDERRQKTMGVITLGLVSVGALETFQVPLWVITLCAGAIAMGTATGGWR